MLRQKKLVQQFVHLQQPFAIQQHLVAFHGEKPPILQTLNRLREFFGEFAAEFFLEIRAADMAELYAAAGEQERAFEFLEKAFAYRSTRLLWLRVQVGMLKALQGTTLGELVEFAGRTREPTAA